MSINRLSTILVPPVFSPPAGMYDLTDLPTMKDELSIAGGDTSKDAFLQRAISQVSVAIKNHCNRVFQVQTISDAIYPQRDAYPYQVTGEVAPLQLSGYPLLGYPGPVTPTTLFTSGSSSSGSVLPFANASAVPVGAPVVGSNIPVLTVVQAVLSTGPIAGSALSSGGGGAGYATGDTGFVAGGGDDAEYTVTGQTGGVVTSYTLTAGTAYSVGAGNATSTGGAQPGTGTGLKIDITSVTVTASQVTISAPLIGPLPANSPVTFGLSVTITCPAASGDATITQLVAGTDYLINGQDGFLTKLNPWTGYPTTWDPVQTNVVYQAGFASIPDDLVDIVLRLGTQRNSARGRDPLLRVREQPGLGTDTFWVGTVPGVTGAFTAEVADLLDRYRVPVTA